MEDTERELARGETPVNQKEDEEEEKQEKEDEGGFGHNDASPTETEISLGEAFFERFTSIPHQGNTQAIKSEQEHMYHLLELANWKISSLNEISEATFQERAPEFRYYVRSLQEMKKQLDSIFRRIRTLKAKVSMLYPEAYAAAQEQVSIHSEDSVDR